MYEDLEATYMEVYNSTYDTAIHLSGKNHTIWRVGGLWQGRTVIIGACNLIQEELNAVS